MAVGSLPVLLVEDEFLIQELVQPALEGSGLVVLTASSGEEAIAMLNTDGFACRALITDVNLGSRITGWVVAKRARELNGSLPVVYITGGHAHQWEADGVPSSILVTKPFGLARIVAIVAQLLDSSERACGDTDDRHIATLRAVAGAGP